MRAAPLALLLALAACASPEAPPDAAPATPEAALADALAAHPGFAVPDDSTFLFLASYRDDPEYGDPAFTPYRLSGDFDGDGTDDLAVLAAGPDSADPEAGPPVRLLVFDGADGWRLAYDEPTDLTYGQALLTLRDGTLGIADAETDFAFEIRPDGDGYRDEYVGL